MPAETVQGTRRGKCVLRMHHEWDWGPHPRKTFCFTFRCSEIASEGEFWGKQSFPFYAYTEITQGSAKNFCEPKKTVVLFCSQSPVNFKLVGVMVVPGSSQILLVFYTDGWHLLIYFIYATCQRNIACVNYSVPC